MWYLKLPIIVMKATIIIITFTSISTISINSTLLCYHIIIMDTITAITIKIIEIVTFSIIIMNKIHSLTQGVFRSLCRTRPGNKNLYRKFPKALRKKSKNFLPAIV